MGKLTKKNKAFMIMILGIILLVGGIAVSISLGAKNIDINTSLKSLLSMAFRLANVDMKM